MVAIVKAVNAVFRTNVKLDSMKVGRNQIFGSARVVTDCATLRQRLALNIARFPNIFPAALWP